MPAKVAVVPIEGNYAQALMRAIALVGGIADINDAGRAVTIKIGLFDPRQQHHSSIEAVQAIIDSFDQAPSVLLVESDNYCGKALDRLERFRPLFDARVAPFNLTGDPEARQVPVAGGEGGRMELAHVLFKPRVLVSTHVMRTFTKGSVLKNLFGCTPDWQKGKFHKNEVFYNQIADIFEAAGGIDLAVMDGAYLHHNASDKKLPMDLLLVGRDAVAVEVVGMTLAGLKPEKQPIIQEFTRRGLGESDLSRIEIVGVDPQAFEALKKRHKALKQVLAAAPKIPGLSNTIDLLAQEGWFDTFRCVPEVVEALKARGVPNAKKELVATTLNRRAGRTLEKVKDGADWQYRRKQGLRREQG